MIKTQIYDSSGTKYRTICISSSGHASTLICSGLSVLTQTVMGFLMNLSKMYPDKMTVQSLYGPGKTAIDVILMPKADRQLRVYMDVLVALLDYGFENARNQEPESMECSFFTGESLGFAASNGINMVRDWREDNGFDPNQMQAPNILEQR